MVALLFHVLRLLHLDALLLGLVEKLRLGLTKKREEKVSRSLKQDHVRNE